jgi:2-amino-4-hydroxy-6-hydroxymethyldihydropteridine diphosphokinase
MKDAYILIGGNMGDRQAYLSAAATLITERMGKIKHSSSVFETAAWGMAGQADFLNQVLLIETSLSPLELLHSLLSAEQELGRFRAGKYGPRTIDMDILFYDQWIVSIPGLQVPHPRIPERRFVLEPMLELAPDLRHPVLNRTIRQLHQSCPDQLPVHKYSDAVHNKA